jgi:hypothetical protein
MTGHAKPEKIGIAVLFFMGAIAPLTAGPLEDAEAVNLRLLSSFLCRLRMQAIHGPSTLCAHFTKILKLAGKIM